MQVQHLTRTQLLDGLLATGIGSFDELANGSDDDVRAFARAVGFQRVGPMTLLGIRQRAQAMHDRLVNNEV